MNFNEMIKNGRENLGVTLSEASQNFGMSIGYLSDFENGRVKKIKMDFIYACAEFYGLSADDLCIAANRIPKDIFYKIVNNPSIFSAIRNLKV